MGTGHPNLVPYQVFETSDGYLMLAVGNDGQFKKACAVMGNPQLALDARYLTNADRIAHRETLVAEVARLIKSHRRDDLLMQFEAAGVPAGPINNLADAHADPQVLHRGLRVNLPAPWLQGSTVPSVRTPIVFSDSQLSLSRPSPRLGEHTEEIQAQLSAR